MVSVRRFETCGTRQRSEAGSRCYLEVMEDTKEMAQMNSIRQSSTEAIECYSDQEPGRPTIRRRWLKGYLLQATRLWNRLPSSLHSTSLGRSYGRHLHHLVRLDADRKQYFATFFLRNRPELELMRHLATEMQGGSGLKIAVLACSKGAEVYSILWALRSAQPKLRIDVHALDISQEILEFAQRGIYSVGNLDVSNGADGERTPSGEDVTRNTRIDQGAPIFERTTAEELYAMCEVEGDQARIRPWLREGITWICGDAGDPELASLLGDQDIVVANRFLCHMRPEAAEECLRKIARLVRPGGYLFVTGIDLDVRTKVAREMNWKPVTELLREIHDGDSSLRDGWPLGYWALEPLNSDRPDWEIRYASVFQIGKSS